MSDLISRSALIKKIKERTEMHSKDYQAFKNYSGDRKIKDIAKWDECEVIIDIVKELPTAEAKPVVKGKWLIKEDESCFATWDYCSVCGFTMGFAGSSHYANFCPNCGCSMKKE